MGRASRIKTDKSDTEAGASSKLPTVFHRLYFDTSTLFSAGWPGTIQLAALLDLARRSRIATIVPAPVHIELNDLWRRRYDEAVSDLRRAGRALEGMAEAWQPPAPPEYSAVERARQAEVEAVVALHGITSAPFPATDVEQLFEAAVNRTLLFGDKDAHFRDSVILLSIRDDLARTPGPGGLLVACDSDYSQERCYDVVPQLRVVKSITDAIDLLKSANRQLIDQWEVNNKALADALEQERDKLTTFLFEQLANSSLSIPGPLIGLFVQPIQANGAFTPLVGELKIGEQNSFECYLRLTLRSAEPSPILAVLSGSNDLSQRLSSRGCVLEGDAHFDGARFSSIHCHRVRFVSEESAPESKPPAAQST